MYYIENIFDYALYYSNLRNLGRETIFFPNAANLMDFQPSRVFVEYRRQFPPVSGENKTVWLALKIRIDKCRNYHKRVEFV